MKKISFEIFPNKNYSETYKLINFLEQKKPSFLSITYNNIDNYNFILNIKNKTKVKIIPHLICDDIYNISKKIINFIKINIFNFIIITGDNEKKNSYFFIKKIRKIFGHTIRIFSGIYLENHKFSKNFLNEILYNYKKKKIGINLFFSQFFINYSIIKYFLNIIKKTGIFKNIVLGIFPKKNINELLNFSNYCKVEVPIWIIKNYSKINFKNYYFKNLQKTKNFHFYSFNKEENLKYYLK